MGLPLHFIRNLSTGAWVGAPVEGLEEGDFDDAYPFTSLGQALGVTEHLRREAKRVGRRVIGFLTRRDPDQYDVVTLTLGDPNDQLGNYQGEIGEAPDDEDGEFEGEPDEGDEFGDDDLGGRVHAQARRLSRFSRWPRLWTRKPEREAA